MMADFARDLVKVRTLAIFILAALVELSLFARIGLAKNGVVVSLKRIASAMAKQEGASVDLDPRCENYLVERVSVDGSGSVLDAFGALLSVRDEMALSVSVVTRSGKQAYLIRPDRLRDSVGCPSFAAGYSSKFLPAALLESLLSPFALFSTGMPLLRSVGPEVIYVCSSPEMCRAVTLSLVVIDATVGFGCQGLIHEKGQGAQVR